MDYHFYNKKFFAVLTIIQLLLWFGHWFVYASVVHFLQITNASLQLGMQLLFGIMSISFVATSLLGFRYRSKVISIAYTIAAAWLGYYWLLLASITLWLTALVLSLWNISIPMFLAQALYVLALGLGTYGLWRGQQLYYTRRTVQLPNLPAQWIDKKIVFVADTHFGHVRGLRFAKKLARAIAAEQPDIVLIGGDFYDGTPLDYKAIAQAFAEYTSTHGTYFITGNHEEFRDKHPFVVAVEQAGIQVLNNERISLDGLTLIGVDYFDSSDPIRFESVLRELTRDQAHQPIILLKHVPDLLHISERHGVALQLSGHTHRGQTWPFSLVTKWLYRGFDYDLKAFQTMQVYTTSGAGTWGPPQRLGTRGEIAILTLTPASPTEPQL